MTTWVRIGVAGVAAIVSWAVGVWLLAEIVSRWPAASRLAGQDLARMTDSWWLVLVTPLGILGVSSLVLVADVRSRGWERSSLRRLVVAPSHSSRVDMFYLLWRTAGGLHVLAFVLSFGTVFWIAGLVHRWFGIAILRDEHWVVQFMAVYMLHSLVFYWGHRLMHTRWFWPLHKVHHAAEEMNVVTPLRNHPIDLAVMTVLHAAPAALIGASPVVVAAHAALNGLYQAWVHSELTTRRRAWDTVVITPAAHRLHHSNRPEHFDRNFGILTLWDRLFGTYLPPDCAAAGTDPLTYGVEDGALYNRPEHLREVFANVKRSLPLQRRRGIRRSGAPGGHQRRDECG